MSKNETSLVRPTDVLTALMLLTRLPVPQVDGARAGAAAWAYPLAGLVVGAVAALAGAAAHFSGLPSPLTALITLAVLVLSTGAMHEDGLADTADGLWGGWTVERRLEIMKDSRIGAYGVIALILTLLARWAALWLLFETGAWLATAAIVTAASLSRATMPALMATLPHARDTGLSHSVGLVLPSTAGLAIAIGVLVALIANGGAAIWVCLWAGVLAFVMARVARQKIGGQTGDILGATQQICEIAILFSLVV